MTAFPAETTAWLLVILAAALVGFAKTGFGGVASLSILLFATVLPAKESTGALLPILIMGDLFAIRFYRHHVEWPVLAKLAPWVVAGVGIGAVVLWLADDSHMRRVIGATLLVLLAMQVYTRLKPKPAEPKPPSGLARKSAAAGTGVAAGATTMVANAAGPVMVLYLLLSGFSKMRFLGTMAWFFFTVNLFKLPFSAVLGLTTWHTLALAVILIPAVALGALAGRALVHRVNQRQFEIATLAVSAIGAVLLVV